MPYRFMIRQIVVVCAIFGAFHAPQRSAAVASDSVDQRIAELEASVEQLKRWRWRLHEPHAGRESLYAGYSFFFAKLHYKEAFQAMVTDTAAGTLDLIPFEHDHEPTPRVWLGYRSEQDLGIRGSYWSFHHSSGQTNRVSDGARVPSAIAASVIFPAMIVAPFPGDRLALDSSLEATTVDLEATYDVRIKRLEAVLGAGIRYGRFDQHFNAEVIPGSAPGAAPASLNWIREFEGMGPLFTAKGKLPVGGSGLYGTGGMNFGFLFGDKTLRRTVVNDATPVSDRGPPTLLLDDADEVTGVYGARIGMGWQRRWRYGTCFAEGAYEGHLWTEGGSPALTFAGFHGISLTLGLAI